MAAETICGRSISRKTLISITQTVERWEISLGIQILYGKERAFGAAHIDPARENPKVAQKPADTMIKNGKYIKKSAENGK